MLNALPTLTFFPTRNFEGAELETLLDQLAKELGFRFRIPSGGATQVTYMQACLESDVVVLDASMAPRAQHNYSVAIPQRLDHVLVVSRTYLPINFYGLRDSIADPDTGKLVYGAPHYPGGQSNQAIERWIRLQLEDLRPSLPRPKTGFLKTMFRDFPRSSELQDRRRKESGQIFISYRSQDSEEVEALKERIEAGNFPGVPESAVRFFPPALLSDELATEQRRWQILSTTDRFMAPAREVWIFEGEDYYNSWWTLGELLTMAYRGRVGYRGKHPARLRIYSAGRGELSEPPEGFLPELTQEQKRRMARWYANTDTAEMGPESIAAIRMMAELPLVRRLFKYFRDPVWSDEFWRHPILDCSHCRVLGRHGSRFDVDDVVWTRGPNFTRITPEEMARCVEQRAIVCPNCRAEYEIYPDSPQYLWMPIVNGHVTARYWMLLFGVTPEDPEEQFLVPLPTYRLRMQGSERRRSAQGIATDSPACSAPSSA